MALGAITAGSPSAKLRAHPSYMCMTNDNTHNLGRGARAPSNTLLGGIRLLLQFKHVTSLLSSRCVDVIGS